MNSARKVNDWFHTVDIDGYSPAHTLQTTLDHFFDAIHLRNDNVIFRENELRKVMCGATCVMYHAQLKNQAFVGPHRIFPRHETWNDDLEYSWKEYIYSVRYNYEFWAAFWRRIHVGLWEEDMPQWRHTIESILVLYIQPSIENMIRSKILFEAEDGNVMDYLETDS